VLHKEAIPGKTIAEIMGHADMDTQFITSRVRMK
jgi:hypothetical protein